MTSHDIMIITPPLDTVSLVRGSRSSDHSARILYLPTPIGASGSSVTGSKPRRSVGKTPVPIKEGMRVTRSMSKEKQQLQQKDIAEGGGTRREGASVEVNEPSESCDCHVMWYYYL